MRLLPLMLLVICCSVSAEWVKSAEGSRTTVFIDPTSVKNNGNLKRIWSLQDYNEKGDEGEQSVSGYEEHDCRESRYRFLSITSFRGSMGTGGVIKTESGVSNWRFIRPDSLAANHHNWLCK